MISDMLHEGVFVNESKYIMISDMLHEGVFVNESKYIMISDMLHEGVFVNELISFANSGNKGKKL